MFISELRNGKPLIVPLTGTRPLRWKTSVERRLERGDFSAFLTDEFDFEFVFRHEHHTRAEARYLWVIVRRG